MKDQEASLDADLYLDLKRSSSGIVLIPQPSADPNDPLTWPLSKKIVILLIVSVSGFVCVAQSLANQAGFLIQGSLYHKTAVEISYSNSAAIVGLATGSLLIWVPISNRIGKSTCIFWSLIGTVACGIWSACMTDPSDYVLFVISRWLGGTFGSCCIVLGAGIILDIFFLHQRGKAFTCYTVFTSFGSTVAGTLSGFIVTSSPWPVQFWWTVGLEAVLALLVFLFVEDTHMNRKSIGNRVRPKSWFGRRIATIYPPTQGPPEQGTYRESAASLILIGLSPTTSIAAVFLMIAFGWGVAVHTLLAVFLQRPIEKHGYDLNPSQTATFTFAAWAAVLVAVLYGTLVNDRLPVWLCRHRGGDWEPEYRLKALLPLPALLLPSGLGLFGASLNYHLHVAALAFANFLITFSDHTVFPVIANYVAENFTDRAAEVSAILNFFRLFLGLLVPFFIDGWEAKVGVGWVFGTMAFLAVFAFLLMMIVAWKGPAIRQVSFKRLKQSERGSKLI